MLTQFMLSPPWRMDLPSGRKDRTRIQRDSSTITTARKECQTDAMSFNIRHGGNTRLVLPTINNVCERGPTDRNSYDCIWPP